MTGLWELRILDIWHVLTCSGINRLRLYEERSGFFFFLEPLNPWRRTRFFASKHRDPLTSLCAVIFRKKGIFDMNTLKMSGVQKRFSDFGHLTTMGLAVSLPSAIKESLGLMIRNGDLTVTFFTFMLPFIVIDLYLNNQGDALIIQMYSVIKLYMFRASSLPIIRSSLLYIRHL